MNLEKTSTPPADVAADAIVIGLWQDEPLDTAASAVNAATEGALQRLIDSEAVPTKKLGLSQLLAPSGITAPIVQLVGLGKRKECDGALAFQAAAAAAKALSARPRGDVALYLEAEPLASGVCGSIVGCVGQGLFHTQPKTHIPEKILWATDNQMALDHGLILGQNMNLARRLVNLPANKLYPSTLAEECQQIALANDMQCEIWDEARLKQEKCMALLSVGQGSNRPPRLVIMRYNGGDAQQKPLALVGKGVTYDSGGLSIKPGASMIDMKMDMGGAATVLAAMQAIAQLSLPINVIGLVGLAENMVSSGCLKPGDIITARSGKTVEVRNTDAEGRLVLADTIDVAIEQGAGRLIDLATLTGACMAALGKNTVGLMTNKQGWGQTVMAAANTAGEPIWQLPMFKEFGEQIKSDVADIKNVGDGRWGATMSAAKFLEAFVQDIPWVHLDIAGPCFHDKPQPWIDAGASGCMVRTLVEVAANYEG